MFKIKGSDNFLKSVNRIFFNDLWYYGLVILLVTIVSLQHYIYTPPVGSSDAQYNYTHYNNFLVFRQSFFHLIQHKDLYTIYPYEYYHLFKYTPTFALLMAPWACLPDLPGLILWNILNAGILFYAFRKFPFSSQNRQLIAVCFIVIEAMTAFGISENNCLIAGLMVLGYVMLENGKIGWAAFLILLSAFVKPFGLAALTLFIFYPAKWRAIGYSVLWFIVLFCLPLFIVSPHELIDIYKNWLIMLKDDHDVSYGLSVMSCLNSWFGIDSKYNTISIGVFLFMLPLLRFKSYKSILFRQSFLAFVLIWVVIFNHKAESPGYIIAVSGVAIWFAQTTLLSNGRLTEGAKLNTALLLLCFLFTLLSPSDLYPRFIREHYFLPYSIKAVPCIIIWVKIFVELITKKYGRNLS